MAKHWTGDEFRDKELERQDRLRDQAKEDNATVAAENEAERVGLDPADLKGTGAKGRVTKKDVEAAADARVDEYACGDGAA